MDKDRLEQHLQELVSGKESTNSPMVRAYLADEGAGEVARLLERSVNKYHRGETPLLPPSSCLPMLD